MKIFKTLKPQNLDQLYPGNYVFECYDYGILVNKFWENNTNFWPKKQPENPWNNVLDQMSDNPVTDLNIT